MKTLRGNISFVVSNPVLFTILHFKIIWRLVISLWIKQDLGDHCNATSQGGKEGGREGGREGYFVM